MANQNQNNCKDDKFTGGENKQNPHANGSKNGKRGNSRRNSHKNNKRNGGEAAAPKNSISQYGLRDGTSGQNDPGFYNKMTGLFTPATSIQVNAQLGVNPLIDSDYPSTKILKPTASVPGIMVMRFTPVVGKCTVQSDPLNQLLTSSYAWYRTNYRASAKYEPADIGLYLIGMSSAVMMWSEFTRITGLVRMAKQRNLYTPQQLVRSLGYSYTDLAKNLSNLEERLNTFAAELRRWPLPKDLAIAGRWIQLCSNVYKDSDAETAQMYVWSPTGYYKYQEGLGNAAGEDLPPQLTYVVWNKEGSLFQGMNAGAADIGGYHTYEDMCGVMDSILTPFFGSSSMAQIASDTTSALGVDSMYTIPDVNVNFTIEPKYQLEEQAQIENTLFVGPVANLNITQTVSSPSANAPSYLVQNPNLSRATATEDYLDYQPLALGHNKLLNFHNPHEVSRDEIMVNSRMMPTGTVSIDPNDPNGVKYITQLGSYGTEIPTTFTIWTLCDKNYDGTPHPIGFTGTSCWQISAPGKSNNGLEAQETIYKIFVMSQLMSAFDWNPLIYKYLRGFAGVSDYFGGITNEGMCLIGIEGDVDQYSIVSNANLQSLHTAAVMSELFIDKTTYYKP